MQRRYRVSLPFLVAVVPAVLALHCAGAPEKPAVGPGAAGSGSAMTSTSASAGHDDSPFVPRSNDAICGGGHRWTGSRCVADDEHPGTTERKAAALARTEPRRPVDGLVIEDINVGNGREVRSGDIIRLHYVGTLADGSIFDSSRSSGPPFEFRVGQGQVIKGFDRGVLGMKVGGRRKVVIPYQLGYGTEGSPPRIPPKAQLTFDLELLDVM